MASISFGMNTYYIWSVLVLIYLVGVNVQVLGSGTDGCVEPEHLPSLDGQNYTDTILAFSNSGRPGWYNALPSEMKGNNSGNNYPNDDRLCSLHRRNRQHHYGWGARHCALSTMALCEFRYEVEYDPHRKPEYLTQTRCVCQRPRGYENNDRYHCQPVTMYVNVYRRSGCVDGVYQYRRVWEKLSVACVSISLPEDVEHYRDLLVSQW